MLALCLGPEKPLLYHFDGQSATLHGELEKPNGADAPSDDKEGEYESKAFIRRSGGQAVPPRAERRLRAKGA